MKPMSARAREAPTAGEVRVRLVVSGDLASMSIARRTVIVEALAAILEIEPGAVRLTAVYQTGPAGQPKSPRWGRLAAWLERFPLRRPKTLPDSEAGVVFELLMPSHAARRLHQLVISSSARLGLLRVKRVILEPDAGSLQEWHMEAGRFVFEPPPPARPVPEQAIRISLFRPILVALMIGCVVWALVHFLRLFFPAWKGSYLVIGSVLAAVEAGYSFRLLQERRRFSDEVLKFRLVEGAMLFILIKIGSYIGQSWVSVWNEIKIWPHAPLTILNIETVVAASLALLAWILATVTAGDLNRLGEPPLRSRYYVSPLESLSQRFFWGGGFLLLVSGAIMLGRSVIDDSSRALGTLLRALPSFSSADLAFVMLLYFLLGLVILGQIRYDLLNRQWQVQGIPVDQAVPRRWARYSLAFVGLTALIALLLPTIFPDTLGILKWVGIAIQWVASIVFYLIGLLIFAIISGVGFLLSFLIRDSQGETMPSPTRPVFDAPPAVDPTRGVTPEWVLLMRSILFWALLLGGLWYVLRTYLRDHPELVEGVKRLKPIRALWRLWTAISARLLGFLRRLLRRWKKSIQQVIAQRAQDRPALRQEGKRRFPFFRLGRLSPRERVLYYYWSILRRAQRLGLARRPSQTPYEYDSALEPHLPQAEEEMDRLTESFIQARYSQHAVEPAQDREVREDWQAVSTALRGLSKEKRQKREG